MKREYFVDSINKTVVFDFDFDEHIVKKIKNCSYNARWNSELEHWVVPIDSFSIPNIKLIVEKFDFKKIVKKSKKDVKVSYKKNDVDFAYLKGLCDSKDFAYTPRDYQLEALGFGIDKGNIINGDDVGLGKCEYVKNRVFTPSGRQEIGSIKVGDFVIGSNGKPTKVTAVHPQSELKKLYRVTFNDNTSVLVSGDHLFNVRTNVVNSKYYTLSVNQMLNEDLVIERKGDGHNKNKVYKTKTYYKSRGLNKWRIPIVDAIEFDNNETLPIDPYMLGVILGDGHITKSGCPYVDMDKDDFSEIFDGWDFYECVTDEGKRKASLKQLRGDINKLNLDYKLSHQKFIPEKYKYSSVENRISILQGLLDTDGYCSKEKGGRTSGVFYYSVSEHLSNDVVELVHSLGGVARLSYKHPKYTYNGKCMDGKKCYIVNIKLPSSIIPFRLSRKVELVKKSDKYTLSRYIKDISFERRDESVCISVEAADSLYVTENGIVTHNTFESIMYTEASNSFPCLVVVPASVKYNWKEKWLEITKGKRSVSVIEAKETRKHTNDWQSDVVVINYDIIGKKQGKGTTMRFEELEKTPWKMVIFDEAHFLKNKTSQRAKAAERITKISDDIIVQLLTGTATMSKPVELWNLLRMIKVEKLISKDWYAFVRRYCGGYRGKFGWVTDGATNTLELNQRLRETCYIRREKRDVLNEMPSVTKQVIQMPITNKKTIESAKDDLFTFLTKTKGEESAEKAMEAQHLVALSLMRKLAIEGKSKAIEQYLKDWKESDKKLVVFGVHKELLEHLSKKFKCPLIAGGVSSKQKQEIVKNWQESKEQFLFANIDSAGTGVDGLQKVCSNMLIIELPWRPSDLTQVIGRLDRSGQKEAVTVTFALSDETIDSEMFEMLADKELVTEAVNKGVDVKRNGSGMRAVLKKIIKKNKKTLKK